MWPLLKLTLLGSYLIATSLSVIRSYFITSPQREWESQRTSEEMDVLLKEILEGKPTTSVVLLTVENENHFEKYFIES